MNVPGNLGRSFLSPYTVIRNECPRLHNMQNWCILLMHMEDVRMTTISLRSYTREVEALIDQGAADEAVKHCKHILKFHPKHVDTYRLLGRAYLESKRYGEAADIFQRVLAVIPDDFV